MTGKVKHSKPIQRADYESSRAPPARRPRSPSLRPPCSTFRAGREGISEDAYPDLAEFFSDVGKAYQEEVADLAAAGCRFLQLDDTNLAYLCDEKQRENARKRGLDPNDLPRHYAGMINEAIAKAPEDMVTGVHLCRGNFRSSWAAEGGYEPVAEVMFNQLEIDAFFLEYDDPRSGDFAPLRFVPKGKTVVLGLVTTKLADMETRDDILRRIEEAAKFMPVDQMALSPQCGFSSTVHGNDIEFEQQAAKMRLVIDVAREVWGEA
ncbi:MAG: 5-methyltetrahydropteroyltriglutamate--homocysteine S-methyltransferase [Sphingomonas sp.]